MVQPRALCNLRLDSVGTDRFLISYRLPLRKELFHLDSNIVRKFHDDYEFMPTLVCSL